MGTRMRNTLMAAIYRKCLRLSSSSLQAESTGRWVFVARPWYKGLGSLNYDDAGCFVRCRHRTTFL